MQVKLGNYIVELVDNQNHKRAKMNIDQRENNYRKKFQIFVSILLR